MKHRLYLIILLFFFLFTGQALKKYFSADQQKITAALKKLFPDTIPELVIKKGDLWQIYKPYEPEKPAAYAFLTTDYAPGVKGYAGPLKILVALKDDGTLIGIDLISHQETPAYVYRLEEPAFAAQFQGKSLQDKFEVGGDLDAMTQATISTTAVYQSVKLSARKVANEKLGLILPLEGPTIDWRDVWRDPYLYLLSLIFLLAIINFYLANANLRYGIMLVSVVYLGFLQRDFYSVFHLINLLGGRLPAWTHWHWYLLITLTLLATLGWGRLYCGNICPFGALSEFIYLSTPYHLPLQARYDKIMREFKYYLMAGVVLVALLASRLEVANFEPFKATFSWSFLSVGGGLSALILFISLINYRFWCKYFCPAGASLALLSWFSFYRYALNNADCKECLECGQTCDQKIGATKALSTQKDNAECIACGRCLDSCAVKVLQPRSKIFHRSRNHD